MEIIIATDIHVYIENGRYFVTERMSKILPRYYQSFGKYSLVARLQKARPHAVLFDITNYIGGCFLFKDFRDLYSKKFRSIIKKVIKSCDLVISRFESFSGLVCYKYAKKYHVKFMGEMMSDPWDGLWNHGTLGKIVAPYAFFQTKKAMRDADFGLYVTKSFLQKRYPCPNRTVCASNVFVANFNSDILKERIEKIQRMSLNEITIMTTAAVYVRYKGQQYMIDAIPYLNRAGIRVKYIIVGDGDQTFLRKRAKLKRVDDQVFFTGRLEYEKVQDYLDQTDIYVQPSLQEGLPRALIEAMSRGCPCLGTKVAGIPELINSECLFDKKSSKAIFKSIMSILSREKLTQIARDNYNSALSFEDSALSSRRQEYFNYVYCSVLESLRNKKTTEGVHDVK